jgi:hypothetical protein
MVESRPIYARRRSLYARTDTKFERDMLDDARRQLKAILERETGDRISIQTFIGH